MDFKLQDLIDIPLFQSLQDKLNEIYSFPSAIIDNDGNVLTATAWQDVCTKFHRVHPVCAEECRASDRYILSHLGEAKPAVTYRCPHGLVDNATPIVINGRHLGNYFTGQFFLEPPDLEFFRAQAGRYGFDERAYLEAVAKVPVWSNEKLRQYLDFIKGFTEILAGIGFKQLQDIEARQLIAEKGEAFEELNAFNQQVIDSVEEGVIVYGPDLRYRLWNPYMERLTGLPAAEVVGRHPVEVFSFLAETGIIDRVAAALHGQPQPVIDVPYRTTAGKAGWASDVCGPLFARNGSVIGVIATVRDITERKRVEDERQVLQEQLLQSQKMESVGRLAGGVAHDFNNMLGIILAHTDLALEQLDPAQPLHAELVEVRNAALRSADLTRQLLAFARKQTISPRIIDLNDAVGRMLRMLQRLIGEDISLTWLPGPELGRVRVDPSQVDQILANLCVNARDAIGGVGKVSIETQNQVFDDDACADHPDARPGEFVRLAVTDNGSGIDPEAMPHLFEPFFTTKTVGRGTGLGLATVYGIVKQNEGFIEVRSRPGQGSTFTVYLPRHLDKAAMPAACGPDRTESFGGAKITVLLVEDEPTILAVGRRLLERLGLSVLAAASPGEAIRIAEDHPGVIDLLITDVVMPEMNGRLLAKRLLALYPNLKRVFMSGYTADVIAHQGVVEEGVHFLQKPFTAGDLAEKIRAALQGD